MNRGRFDRAIVRAYLTRRTDGIPSFSLRDLAWIFDMTIEGIRKVLIRNQVPRHSQGPNFPGKRRK